MNPRVDQALHTKRKTSTLKLESLQRQQEANETIGNEVTPDQSADLQDKETPKDFYILKRMNENQSMFSEKSQKSPNPLRNNNGVFPLQNRDNFGSPEVITS